MSDRLKYHAPRTPDEAEVYEVEFAKSSVYFERVDTGVYRLCNFVDTSYEDTPITPRHEKRRAAVKLIRERRFTRITDTDGAVIAELTVGDRYEQNE